VQAILRNSPDAIIVLDPDFRLEMHNPAFTDLFGYEKETIPATFPACLVSGDQRGELMQALNAMLKRDEPLRLTLTARRRDGGVFDADMALAPVYQDESVRSIVCSLRDITPLKQVERLKDEFVSNVSHELRTPITSLKLYHDLIGRNPKRQAVYLDRLGREIKRLNILVEDLLRLSRLDQNRINWETRPVDLNELARQYVIDRRPLATERAIQLQLEAAASLPPVTADASMVEQALSALLTNAINYTPQGGTITVRTCAQAGMVGVRVEDSGPGISAEEQKLVFHRFYRGQSGRASGAPGTGLGLSIAQEIVEWHNGRIEIESEMGQGSAFTIWLPLETETDET
jgi:two-component system phosphate regulon sensor histidine kinase PhoR